MSTTFVPVDNVGNGFTIITHVIVSPTSAGDVVPHGPSATQLVSNEAWDRRTGNASYTPRSVEKLMNKEPKALGVVQITIGLMTFLFGIVLTIYAGSEFTVYSGIVYWGPVIYISSGCLTIAVECKPNLCLVKGSLAMNLLSSLAAGIVIVLLSLDLAFWSLDFCSKLHSDTYCDIITSRSNGIYGVLLVFSVLQFIISMVMMLFSYDVVYAQPAESFNNQRFNRRAFRNHSLRNQDVFTISNPSVSTAPPPPEYSETDLSVQP